MYNGDCMRKIKYIDKGEKHYALLLPFPSKENAEKVLSEMKYLGEVVEIVK